MSNKSSTKRRSRRTAPTRRGNCYVTSEAVYHLLGGKKNGWKPMHVRHEGDTHWFLVKRMFPNMPLAVLDLTKSQFKTPVPYHKGRGSGFLTKKPSKRARELMRRLVWQ